MPGNYSVDDLPYSMLSNKPDLQLKLLAEILGIPKSAVSGGGKPEVNAMVGTILYRHLDHIERMNVMEAIRSLPNRALQGRLITLVVDTTYVNPQWGMWSLTNEELLLDQRFHSRLDRLASKAGLTISGLGLVEILKKVKEQRKIGPELVATLVIWGAVYVNAQELEQTENEIRNRTNSQMIDSRYFAN